MTSLGRNVAQRGVALAALLCTVWALPFVLACSPLSYGILEIERHTVVIIEGERHVVIRVSPEVLMEASNVLLAVSLPAEGIDSITLLPDSPSLMGASTGGGPMVRTLSASTDVVDGLGACASDGLCEVGFTIFVEPSLELEGTEPEVFVTVRGVHREAEHTFSEAADIELEVDGELPVQATRGFR
jgi:hypothetical protein